MEEGMQLLCPLIFISSCIIRNHSQLMILFFFKGIFKWKHRMSQGKPAILITQVQKEVCKLLPFTDSPSSTAVKAGE